MYLFKKHNLKIIYESNTIFIPYDLMILEITYSDQFSACDNDLSMAFLGPVGGHKHDLSFALIHFRGTEA